MTTGNNQFLPLAIGSGANVLTPAAYAALSTLIQHGYQSGVAQSIQVNTTLRQATFVASAIAQIIANSGVDANDDGNISEFVTNLLNALYASPALTGSPTAPNQAQFDNSTKLATTEFVQQAIGNRQSAIPLTDSATISIAKAGSLINFHGPAGKTIALPSAVGVGGASFVIVNGGGSPVTLTSAGGIFSIGTNSTSQILGPSTSVEVISDGTNWDVISGVSTASLATNGYQILQSGLIIQWGLAYGVPPTGSITTPSYATVNFPISFTNSVFSIQVAPQDTYGGNDQMSTPLIYSDGSPTHFSYGNTDQDTGIGNFRWLAFGY